MFIRSFLVSVQVEEKGSFSFLSQVISDHEAATRKIPESIEHLKSLNAEMHLLRHQIQSEDLAHKEAIVTGSRTLSKLKQVQCSQFLLYDNFLCNQ